MMEEVIRTRALESKAFQEKEELRSKLEELYEEKDKILQVWVGLDQYCLGHLYLSNSTVQKSLFIMFIFPLLVITAALVIKPND